MLKGFIENMPNRDYHQVDAASSHRLGLLKKSPAHLRWELSNPREATDAMRFGQAVHACVLEPHKFHDQVIKGEKFGRKKEDQEAKKLFEAQHSNKIILDPDEYNDCQNIAIACKDHPLAGALLALATHTELSGFFNDPVTGIYCKLRADAICEHQETIFDLKTTDDASTQSFEKSIFNFGYHRQAAFYIDGCNVLGKSIKHYAIIAVEKKPPYALAVYRLKNESIELGRKENTGLMQLYRNCFENNRWPGYPDQFVDVGLPVWAQKQIERAING